MLTPQLEAQVSLLLYCWFGFGALLMYMYYKRKGRQMNRKDHLIEMWILRINELSLLIEEAWMRTPRNKNQ